MNNFQSGFHSRISRVRDRLEQFRQRQPQLFQMDSKNTNVHSSGMTMIALGPFRELIGHDSKSITYRTGYPSHAFYGRGGPTEAADVMLTYSLMLGRLVNQRRDSTHSNILSRSLDSYKPQASPITAFAFSQLPVSVVDDTFLETTKCDACAICQEKFEEKEKYITLPCFDVFHKDCIAPWFKEKSTCPLCRFDCNETNHTDQDDDDDDANAENIADQNNNDDDDATEDIADQNNDDDDDDTAEDIADQNNNDAADADVSQEDGDVNQDNDDNADNNDANTNFMNRLNQFEEAYFDYVATLSAHGLL